MSIYQNVHIIHTQSTKIQPCICTFSVRWSGSQRYSVILSTRMQPIVRTANALISGFGSCESCIKRQTSCLHIANYILREMCACLLLQGHLVAVYYVAPKHRLLSVSPSACHRKYRVSLQVVSYWSYYLSECRRALLACQIWVISEVVWPWQMCWRPWWPDLAVSLRNWSDKDIRASSARDRLSAQWDVDEMNPLLSLWQYQIAKAEPQISFRISACSLLTNCAMP